MSRVRDILDTLRERADEVTLKNRAMDEAPLGITIADMTEPDQPLVYINDGFERMTGYDESYAIGRNCRFLQGPETSDEARAEFRAAVEENEAAQVVIQNYRKGGELFWNEVTLAPIFDDDGEVPYYVGFQQDVTLRKEYEDRLESQRDDLDILNQIVRHDIRNDLQVVLAALEVLEGRVRETERQHVTRALKSTREAIELTATARSMANVMLSEDAEFEAIDLRAVVTAEVDNVRSTHPTATVTIDGEIPSVEVQADGMLESVFRNLLTNAIQHNDTDAPTVTVSATATDKSVTVTVADDGPGFPEALKSAAFKKGVTGEHSQSTGFGLYLLKRLVDNYGGRIEVADNDPRGAVITVELPLAD